MKTSLEFTIPESSDRWNNPDYEYDRENDYNDIAQLCNNNGFSKISTDSTSEEPVIYFSWLKSVLNKSRYIWISVLFSCIPFLYNWCKCLYIIYTINDIAICKEEISYDNLIWMNSQFEQVITYFHLPSLFFYNYVFHYYICPLMETLSMLNEAMLEKITSRGDSQPQMIHPLQVSYNGMVFLCKKVFKNEDIPPCIQNICILPLSFNDRIPSTLANYCRMNTSNNTENDKKEIVVKREQADEKIVVKQEQADEKVVVKQEPVSNNQPIPANIFTEIEFERSIETNADWDGPRGNFTEMEMQKQLDHSSNHLECKEKQPTTHDFIMLDPRQYSLVHHPPHSRSSIRSEQYCLEDESLKQQQNSSEFMVVTRDEMNKMVCIIGNHFCHQLNLIHNEMRKEITSTNDSIKKLSKSVNKCTQSVEIHNQSMTDELKEQTKVF